VDLHGVTQLPSDAGTSFDADGGIMSDTWVVDKSKQRASGALVTIYPKGNRSRDVAVTVTDNSGAGTTITKAVEPRTPSTPPDDHAAVALQTRFSRLVIHAHEISLGLAGVQSSPYRCDHVSGHPGVFRSARAKQRPLSRSLPKLETDSEQLTSCRLGYGRDRWARPRLGRAHSCG
jgi:hypothetical protein